MNDALLDQLAHELAARVARELARACPTPPPTGVEGASPWLNLEHAAAYLDWPKQRLYKLTAQNAIPHYKQEGRLLFRRDELDRWLDGYANPGR